MNETRDQERKVRLADLKILQALKPFIRPYLWMLALTTLLVFAVTGLELIIPILTQKAVDHFIFPVSGAAGVSFFGIDITSFKIFCLVYLLIILGLFVIDFFQSLFMEYTGQKIILNLRCRLFTRMAFLPVPFYDENSSGRLVSRITNDIENMNEMFTSVLIFIFKDLIIMAGIMLILFNISFKLALYISTLIPVIILSILFFAKKLREIFRTIRQKIAEINHSFSEAITGIKIIQTTSSTDRFAGKFEALNFSHYTAALYQIKIFSIFMPFIGFLGTVSVAMIVWAGSFEIIEKHMTIGSLIAFFTYMKLFFRPLRELSEKFNLLQSALASAERIVVILGMESAKKDSGQNRVDTISRIEFEGVHFAYKKNEPVLRNISFGLKKGESIGIAGHTGSGKTSIINLISGFYRPDTGRIRVNGRQYETFSTESIRNKTALVMQDPFLVAGSIRDNIDPGHFEKNRLSQAELQKIEQSLYEANCDFLFEKFSGPDTIILEGGKPLSSGEKQLVSIARAFARNPDLIIFDEATSYMDSQSEQKIHDAMKKLMKGRLSIIIAHRLSTIRHCDHIIVLRDGRIRESGTHSQLVRIRGEYYHLLQKERI